MSPSPHVDIDALTSYLAAPHSADAGKIGLHLAQCAPCRSRLETLSAMRGHLTVAGGDDDERCEGSDGQLAQMFEHQEIERYVDGGLTEGEGRRVAAQLKGSPQALKAALHYASHSAAMRRGLNPGEPSSAAGDTDSRRVQDKSPWKAHWTAVTAWLSRRIPLWTTLPVGGLATGILLVSLTFMQTPSGGHVQIASYQDNPVVQFRAPSQAPGIGFFGTAAKSSLPFEPVRVAAVGTDGVTISWPAIPAAKAYVVRLTRRQHGGSTPLAERTTTATTATFEGLEIIVDHRYVWTLSGKTTDKKDFYAEGGFVFHRPEN